MPSSRGRGWYCSAAARLQPPVDERPARTAPGFNRRCWSRRRGSRRGRTRRSPALRGRRGASFFYVDREHGHARRARWAARIPPTPIPLHLLPRTAQSPPTTLRTAEIDRASEPALASEAPSCSAISPRLPTRAAAWGFEPASATPGRTGGARWRGPPTGVPGGIARSRRQLSPEGPARARSTPPLTRRGPESGVAPGRPRFWERGAGHSQLHGGFRRQCDGQKFGIWDKNCGHI